MIDAIALLQKNMAVALPTFYIDFLIREKLLQSRPFSALTLLYGTEDLQAINASAEVQTYLPNYLCIGNNGGDYGFFIGLHGGENTHIYVCGLGDLDESSLDKIADSFALWAEKSYESEDFLNALYQNQFTSPLLQLRGNLQALEKQERLLKTEKEANAIDLKSYLQKKRALKPAIAATQARLIALEAKKKSYKSPPVSIAGLEQRHEFKFPVLYKKLYYDGMLDWGLFGADWSSDVLPMLMKSPPLLLFAKEFELLHARDIDETIHVISQFHPTVNHRFIPIGVSGAGDIYAFHIDAIAIEAMPIVYIWHDDNRCDYLAKNLQDFIFLKMLESILEIEEEYDMVSSGDLRTNLDHWLLTHKKYLTDNQVAILQNFFSRDMQAFKHVDKTGIYSEYFGLISKEEYDVTVSAEIDFPFLNTSFKCAPDS